MRGIVVCLFGAAAMLGCGGGAQYGAVTFGELVASGEVDVDYLHNQLHQLDPPFEACYVQALRRDRSAEGVIALQLRGGDNRLVPELSSNGTGNDELGQCVVDAIAGLSIREPEDSEPWDYTADWSVTFEIVGRNSR